VVNPDFQELMKKKLKASGGGSSLAKQVKSLPALCNPQEIGA
jgi:hypothetical protein